MTRRPKGFEASMLGAGETTRETTKIELETYPQSEDEAQMIMGADFLGSIVARGAFGYTPETIPPIPFSMSELERAKELGQQLILYVDRFKDEGGLLPSLRGKRPPLTMRNLYETDSGFEKRCDGKLLWAFSDEDYKHFRKMPWFNAAPRAGWRLVSKEALADSEGKGYLEQTRMRVEELKRCFPSGLIPEPFSTAIEEFEKKEAELMRLEKFDSRESPRVINNLLVNQLLGETPVEVVYRIIMNDRQSNRILLKTGVRTSELGSYASVPNGVTGYFTRALRPLGDTGIAMEAVLSDANPMGGIAIARRPRA